jgi:hypothetical protein
MRPLRALIALLFAAVTLTGCMKLDMNLEISESQDTVNGSMIFAIQKTYLTMGGKSPAEAFNDSKSLTEGLPAGSRTEVYEDAKFYGQRIIFENVPFSEFNDGEPDSPNLSHADGRYTFTLTAGGTEDDPQMEAFGDVFKEIEMTIAVTFPGRVIEHDDLAKVDGRKVTWVLPMDEKHTLRAVAEEASSMWLLMVIGGGLLGVLLLGAIIFIAIRATRRPHDPALNPANDGRIAEPPPGYNPATGAWSASPASTDPAWAPSGASGNAAWGPAGASGDAAWAPAAQVPPGTWAPGTTPADGSWSGPAPVVVPGPTPAEGSDSWEGSAGAEKRPGWAGPTLIEPPTEELSAREEEPPTAWTPPATPAAGTTGQLPPTAATGQLPPTAATGQLPPTAAYPTISDGPGRG